MEKKKKVGRPTIPESEKRKPRFLLKLSDDEYETITQAAGSSKVSTWARETLLKSAKRLLK